MIWRKAKDYKKKQSKDLAAFIKKSVKEQLNAISEKKCKEPEGNGDASEDLNNINFEGLELSHNESFHSAKEVAKLDDDSANNWRLGQDEYNHMEIAEALMLNLDKMSEDIFNKVISKAVNDKCVYSETWLYSYGNLDETINNVASCSKEIYSVTTLIHGRPKPSKIQNTVDLWPIVFVRFNIRRPKNAKPKYVILVKAF